MALKLPEPIDPNDPINILLMPFDPLAKMAPVAAGEAEDPIAKAQADAEASQAAAAAAAAAAEAERQRVLAEQQANLLRQGGNKTATIFGGAEGEVLYESNVRPSARRWESSNRVEVRKTVQDFNMSEPLPPQQLASENAFASSLSPISFSVPIQVVSEAPVAAAPPTAAPAPEAARAPAPAPVAAAPPAGATTPKMAPKPAKPVVAAPASFSPTAGVHPQLGVGQVGVDEGTNKTEELMKKVHGGSSKVRQCPSFRMLEFQLEYSEYKETKTAVS